MTARAAIDQTASQATLFGYAFAAETAEQLAAQAATVPPAGAGSRLVVTANLDHIVQLRRDARLQRAYANAWRRTIDGTPVYAYARLRGIAVPERITGADLLPDLLQRLQPGQHRLFFVVADAAIAAGVARWAESRGFAPGEVETEVPHFGFEKDAAYGARLAAQIRERGTTQLFFGVGCPKSEVWLDEHRDTLGDCYAFAVGAAVAFFVGTQPRAPAILRRTGLEWTWRVYQEPGRLGKRYFLQSWGFLAAIAEDVRAAGRTPR